MKVDTIIAERNAAQARSAVASLDARRRTVNASDVKRRTVDALDVKRRRIVSSDPIETVQETHTEADPDHGDTYLVQILKTLRERNTPESRQQYRELTDLVIEYGEAVRLLYQHLVRGEEHFEGQTDRLEAHQQELETKLNERMDELAEPYHRMMHHAKLNLESERAVYATKPWWKKPFIDNPDLTPIQNVAKKTLAVAAVVGVGYLAVKMIRAGMATDQVPLDSGTGSIVPNMVAGLLDVGEVSWEQLGELASHAEEAAEKISVLETVISLAQAAIDAIQDGDLNPSEISSIGSEILFI